MAEGIISKAAILEKLNAPLVVDSIEMPELTCGQVLVRVLVSGICGTQLGEINGSRGPDKHLPHLLGHEGGGIVSKIGPGVTRVKQGDHVVMHWRRGPGIEAYFPKYIRNNGTIVGGGLVTTFNEFAVVSENRLTPIDDDIPYDIAALMGCAVTTGLGVINNEAKLKIGQSIAVFGCGGVGLSVIQGAAIVSANPIIALDKYKEKLNMARYLGATHVVDLSLIQDVKEFIFKTTGHREIDVTVECTGLTNPIEEAYDLTAPNGHTILVGLPGYDQDLRLRSIIKGFKGKTLICSEGGKADPAMDIPRYLALYFSGKLKLHKMITHKYPLEKINEALDTVRSGDAGRVMITMA